MKIINKYIFRNFLSNFLIYFCVTTFLLLLSYLYQIINSLIIHRTDFVVVVKLFLLLIPSVFSLTVPIAILISTLLTFSVLNEMGELLTLHTMGVKKSFYMINFILFSLFLTLTMVYFNTTFVPKSYRRFRNIFINSVISKPFINFSQNVVTVKNKKIVSQNVVQQQKNKYFLSNVYIHNLEENNIIQTIFAHSADVYTNTRGDIVFDLHNGEILMFNKFAPTELIQLVFDNYKFVVYNEQIQKFFSEPTSLRELTNNELLLEFNKTKSDRHKRYILSEYFLRYTVSISIFIFSVVGIIFGTKIKRNVKPLSFVIAIIVILFYYFVLLGCMSVIERGQFVLTFFVALVIMQIPNILLAIVSFLTAKIL